MKMSIQKGFWPVLLTAALLTALLTGCGPRKHYAPTPEGEFEAAFDAFEREKYATSIERFKQIIYKYPGSDLVEQARFFLADSYFNNREFQLASDEFERLNREFPQGRYADVSMFKSALAYQQMSRRVERDQSETAKSLETLELLLAKYPNTKFVDTVNVHISRLKDKLGQKEFRIAMFYFKRGFYDSAIIYLKSVLEEYAEAKNVPDALYYLYLASDKMGYPDDAKDARDWLCSKFPENVYARRLIARADSLAAAPADTASSP